jgi:hypothetical protein
LNNEDDESIKPQMNVGDTYYAYYINKQTLRYRIYVVRVMEIDHVEYLCEIVESSDGSDVDDIRHFLCHELFQTEKECLERLFKAVDNMETNMIEIIHQRTDLLNECTRVKGVVSDHIQNLRPKLRAV